MVEFRQRSLREAARQGSSKSKAQPPIEAPQAQTLKVKALCGHEVDFPLFPEGKDLHRESRLKKATDQACKACRQKAHLERTTQDQAASQEKRKAKLAEKQLKGRLPHGAKFDLLYNAEEGMWTGTLEVPGVGKYAARCSAVFRLMSMLDAQYRKGLALENKSV